MHFNLCDLANKWQFNVTGVIQAGAHYGEEIGFFDHLQVTKRVLFEPVKSNFDVLDKHFGINPHNILIKKALGSQDGILPIYTETDNRGESCSILAPKEHLVQFPYIKFDELQEIVDVTTLDTCGIDLTDCNFLMMDTQGYELEVLKGASKTLEHVDYIVTEVMRAELYEGATMYEELCAFLYEKGFSMVEQNWVGGTYGDCLFIKQKN